jgi:hypothetical protein
MREAMLKKTICPHYCPQKIEKFCGEVLLKVISVGP